MLILALLVMRIGGVHLHLCFDGLESSATVHTSDGSIHDDEHHLGQSHNDQDVDVLDGLLKKPGQGLGDLAILLAFLLPFAILSSSMRIAVVQSRAPPLLHPFDFHPPLRGPPA